jgi:hypothetical protein
MNPTITRRTLFLTFVALWATTSVAWTKDGEDSGGDDNGGGDDHGGGDDNSGGGSGGDDGGSGSGDDNGGGDTTGGSGSGSNSGPDSGQSGHNDEPSDTGIKSTGNDFVDRRRKEQELASRSVKSGKAASLRSVIAHCEKNYNGKVLDVKLRQQKRGLVYEVRILTKTSFVRFLSLDAKTLKKF